MRGDISVWAWVADQVKRLLIIIADIISLVDPFDEFDRVQSPKYFEYLWEKAKKFNDDMGTFYWPEYNIYRYKLPTDSGDQCLWHGIATAMTAIKSSVTCGYASQLQVCMEGLGSFLLDGHRLVRGWREDRSYQDDVSNDQCGGFLAGVYFGWKYGDYYCKNLARKYISILAKELLNNNHALVNVNGQSTTYGALEQGWKTDPLRLTLLLAVYKVAYTITEEPVYADIYNELASKHLAILSYAKVRLLWWDTDYDTHRAAIHYTILCDLETDKKLHRAYFRGLERVWRIARKSANPWVFYLARRHSPLPQQELDRVLKHLNEMTLEDKQWNVEKINSSDGKWQEEGVRFFNWGGRLRASQPLPRWKIGSQDFFWQRNLYSVDDWVGNKQADARYNGLDFLAAYWGLRSLNLINANQ